MTRTETLIELHADTTTTARAGPTSNDEEKSIQQIEDDEQEPTHAVPTPVV